MTDQYFDELKKELHKGATDREHPFRYFTLATVGVDYMVRQRLLVLRKASEDLQLTFFTDYRSKKIMHLHENNKVSMLFYDPDRLLQVRIDGLAAIDRDEAAVKAYWNSVREASRKAYMAAAAPGTDLENPELLEYLHEDNYFCAVNITPFKIEYLKLQEPNHIRVDYSRMEGFWDGQYLVP